jgi:hypothetical protein
MITDVSTPKELEAAVQQGAEHIRLRAHMDLRGLTLSQLCPDGGCEQLVLFQVANATDSIQVRSCTSCCHTCSCSDECSMGSQLGE